MANDAFNRNKLNYSAAEVLTGLPRSDLRRLVAARRIPHLRFGPRTVRFDADELRDWMRSRRREP